MNVDPLENRLCRVQSIYKRNGLAACDKTGVQLSKNTYFSVSYRELWKWFLYMCLDTCLMHQLLKEVQPQYLHVFWEK